MAVLGMLVQDDSGVPMFSIVVNPDGSYNMTMPIQGVHLTHTDLLIIYEALGNFISFQKVPDNADLH